MCTVQKSFVSEDLADTLATLHKPYGSSNLALRCERMQQQELFSQHLEVQNRTVRRVSLVTVFTGRWSSSKTATPSNLVS